MSQQHIARVPLLVDDYDEALRFYVDKLGFHLIEDTPLDAYTRWVIVAPQGPGQTQLLLAKADTAAQAARVGDQSGGRVLLFLYTDDFAADYARYRAAGVEFLETPRNEPYGTVAVFKDLYGNLWDLLQPA